MPNGKTNVDLLREGGVIPAGATLAPQHEKAINGLSPQEVQTVLDVHGKVGTIEIPGPMWSIKIF